MRVGLIVGSANMGGVRRVLARAIEIFLVVITVLSFVLTIPDVPAQVAKWKPWLTWVNYDVVRWLFLASGLVGVLVLVVWEYWRRMTAKKRKRLEDYRELYRLSIEGAAREARMVVTHIATSAKTQDATSNYLGRLLEECVSARTERSTSELARVLQNGRDPQDPFVTFWVDYQRHVLWMRDAGQALSYGFAGDGNYALWRQYDEGFLMALNQMMARSTHQALREWVHRNMWVDGGIRQYW
jgi:hypothetical protein